MSALRQAGLTLHRYFAWHPRLAKSYLTAWAWLLGFSPDGNWLKRHIGNNLRGANWPPLKLKPRKVQLVPGISALLVPRTGTLSFRSLWELRMGHEPGVPDFLAARMSRYDAVLEIGANIGIYTLLFSQCLPRDGSKRVFAYEPSPKAYEFLEEHLALNQATNVAAFNCAVASVAGTVPFYQNNSDLMKGSLRHDVSVLFAGARPDPIQVAAVGIDQIAPLLRSFPRVLLKLDAMGAEPDILAGFRDWLSEKRPDIVVGVWSGNFGGLSQLTFLPELYQMFRIDPVGLVPRTGFEDAAYCNYFLEARAAASIQHKIRTPSGTQNPLI